MAKKNWQLTRGQRLSYSVGMFSSAIVTATVMAWLLYFYSPPPNAIDEGMVFLGIGIAVGLARLLGSAVDAITNPLVAFWSDRSTNPKGRRIPFIRRGVIPLMAFAVLVWFPPVNGTSMWNVIWLAVTLSGTWFFFTYVVAPYLALMPEITTNPEERVSLTVTMAYFEAGAILVSSLAVPPVIDALKKGIQMGPFFIADGFKFTAIVLAIMGGIGFFISVARVKEKEIDISKTSTLDLKNSIVECFRNPAFPPYLLAVSSAKIAIGLVMISMPFLATAVLHKGEGFTAALLAPMFLSTLAGFIVAEKFVNRVGLKYAFRVSTLVATVVVFGFVGVYFMGGGAKPLASVTTLQSGDLWLQFSENPKEAQEPKKRFRESGDAVDIRLTRLEWDGLFKKADMDHFHEWIADTDDPTLEGCLREDTAQNREMDSKPPREWLLKQPTGLLLQHLTMECGEQLLVSPKRRYEERLYLTQVGIPEAKAGAIRIPVQIGSVPEPPETFNLEGWSMIISNEEEREKMTGPAALELGEAVPFLFEGTLEYVDGSLLLSSFELLEGTPEALRGQPAGDDAIAQLEELLPEQARLNNLLSRFEFRKEFQWSSRIYIILLLLFLLGFPAAVLMSMYRPIVCEIVDLDEERVGARREAIYFGVEGLLTKLADGVSAVVAPAVMLLGHLFFAPPFGYILPFGAAGFFMVAAWWVFGKYPLGEATGIFEEAPHNPEEGQVNRLSEGDEDKPQE